MTGEELARLLTGPFLAACALLAIAGTTKVMRPETARDAARALRLPGTAAAVRALGTLELLLAVGGVLIGRGAALAVAGCYALLAVTALMLWRRAPGTPCGCLGTTTTPATGAHVVLNVCASGVAAVSATGASPLSVIADQPLLGTPLLVLTACATWLAALVMDALPALRAVVREGSS
ncbi:MAG: MauE/DoxX family redox-associated membrane protein [Acidimicrobiia bacterium]